MAHIKSKNKDFTEGPIFSNLFKFAVPMVLAAVLQSLYQTADHFVVSKFSGDHLALAGIASTNSLISLMINALIGISVGASVCISHSVGAKDEKTVNKAVHTSLFFAFLCGIAFMVVGLTLSHPALVWLKTKPELMERAILYLRIICLGMPAVAIYNFGAAILRAAGDSRTPLTILTLSGIVNLVLNLLLVIIVHMSVEGVAIATIISNYLSAVAVMFILIRRDDYFKLCLSRFHIDKKILGDVLKYGIPTGLQSSLFAISNIFLAGGLNTLETVVISAKAVSGNIENICNTAVSNFGNSLITFVGQNYGAKKPDRIRKSIILGVLQVVICGFVLALPVLLFREPLARLFVDATDPNADLIVHHAAKIMTLLVSTYFLCGTMQAMSGSVRGMGHTAASTIITLIGACVLRILWVEFIFPLEAMHNAVGLYLSFPVTWVITTSIQAIFFSFVFKKFKKEMGKVSI